MSDRRRPRGGDDERRRHRSGRDLEPQDRDDDDLTVLADLTIPARGDHPFVEGVDPDDFDDDSDAVDDDAENDDEAAGTRTRQRRRDRGRRRPAVSGMRLLVTTIAVILVVIAGFVVAYFTPLMSVRTIDVAGDSVVSAEEILAAAALSEGQPLMQVDTAAAARRVSMIPRIATVRVKREYPSTITISVVERVAVVFTQRDGQKYLMDNLGFEFAQQDPPPGLAELQTANPGSGDPSTRAALTVMGEVPPYVRDQIAAIEVDSPVDIALRLKDNRTVIWGDDERNVEKAETLRHVLTQEGTEYNVSSPQNPTFK
ncbi:cell division protein FtsQ [Williamsia limnetica]|uniref:Cell division protein FtsQ n=1 Tax=Williamsia limnetica TaxID=882452 RepID=A0A318RG26_WILLI|nr:FtsQ-type POTRA domain-containing protein [Williamsia limnetica]PYE15801.1 cell division protein FtsQ [Williamsia limnetica]